MWRFPLKIKMVDTSILSEKFSVALNFYCTCKVIEEGFSRLYCFKERQLYERIISHIFHLISDPDTKSSSKILDECGILLDSVWETINIGHWRDVDLFWRQLYRTICLLNMLVSTISIFNGNRHKLSYQPSVIPSSIM